MQFVKKFNRELDIVNGNVVSGVLLFALPLIMTSILQLLFNAADVVVVGQFCGKNSLAAVSSNGALVNLIINLLLGLAVGVNVVVSNAYGAKNKDAVERAVHTAMLIAIIGGFVFGVLGFSIARPVLNLMNTPDTVIDKAVIYLRIYFCGLPASMIYNFGATILNASGDTRRPLYIMICSGVVNVIFNVIFVTLFNMDVAGVALATVISLCLSATLVLKRLITSNEWYKLYIRKLKIHPAEFIKIVKVGVPNALQGMAFSISNVIIQASVNIFGDVVMAGNGAAANIDGFVYFFMNAFSKAAITFTATNIGAKNLKKIKKITWCCVGFATLFGILSGGSAYLFQDTLLKIYIPDPASFESIAYASIRMGIISTLYFLCGAMEAIAGTIIGMGNALIPMIVSLGGICGFRIIWCFTYFEVHKSVDVLYWSWPISWIIAIVVYIPCYLIIKRKTFKKYSE